jgi:hypothetical protein
MSGHIFNIQDDGTLVEMNEQEFENEDIFQTLLERYPNLLAGDQINSADPRRSNAINHYQVILTNTEKHRKELDKIGKPASDTLTQLAEESEFELKPLDNLRLSIENVEFLTDSMSELGDLVADAILKYLNMIEKFDAWLNSR